MNTDMLFQINDLNSGNWWNRHYGVFFKVLSIRQFTVLVKACKDEEIDKKYPYHEFPKEAGIIIP